MSATLTELRANLVWLCFYGDGESDGRFILGKDYTAAPSDVCPICGWDKGYHGCRWVRITQE